MKLFEETTSLLFSRYVCRCGIDPEANYDGASSVRRLHMCKGVYRAIGFLVSGIVLSSTTVEAQQSLAVNAGYFAVRGESTRGAQDVLVENLSIFAFDLKEFNGLTVGGEWIFGISNHLEAGLGIGFYQRSVPSIYSGFVDTEGLNIFQEFPLNSFYF